jgi:hypothetical protein
MRVRGSGTFVCSDGTTNQATRIFVLIMPSLQGLWNVAGFYYLPAIVQGFCVEATRLGYEPIIISGDAEMLRLARNNTDSIGGIACLLVQGEDNRTAEKLSELGFPFVCINAYHGRRALASISADQRQRRRPAGTARPSSYRVPTRFDEYAGADGAIDGVSRSDETASSGAAAATLPSGNGLDPDRRSQCSGAFYRG